ncbi:MAG: hypothetical protein U9Q82_12440 [Chloroflexota bacterium]|nr:hypothetical protein [Chloroflexota bacterium]
MISFSFISALAAQQEHNQRGGFDPDAALLVTECLKIALLALRAFGNPEAKPSRVELGLYFFFCSSINWTKLAYTPKKTAAWIFL